MKNNILNKCIRYLSFCSFFLLLYGCSNDDNGTIEVESEISTPSGTISFTINNSAVNKETILNLENGDFLEQMEVTGPVAIAEHREHTYLFRENSLVKQDGNGNLIWEKTYPEDELNPFEIFRSNTVFEEQAVFFSYSRLDTFTFERTHFLECVSLVDGGTIWIKNVSGETFPSLVNGRLLALTYPNGNSPVNFAYLDKENGSTTFEKTYEERIDPSNLTIDRNTILVSSWGDRVFALNTMLNEEWSFETGAENVRNGIIARNQLIFPSRDRNVYALNKDTGTLNWQSALEIPNSKGFHTHNDISYVLQKNEDKVIVFKIDNEDGTLQTRTELQLSNPENSIYTAFFEDYMVLANPTNDVRVSIRLIYLPSAQVLWQTDSVGIGTRNLQIKIQLDQ